MLALHMPKYSDCRNSGPAFYPVQDRIVYCAGCTSKWIFAMKTIPASRVMAK